MYIAGRPYAAVLPEHTLHIEKIARLEDEAVFVKSASEGDQQAYAHLYTYYYSQLYTSLSFIAGSHEDTQEIIQETFLKIWNNKENLVLVRSFEDYAYTIAKNSLFNLLKRKKINRKAIDALSDPSVPNTGPAPDEDLLFKQYHQTALAAIELLPAQQKRVFLLRTQEGLSLGEIAAEMGISLSTVKKHLYLAIEFVKDHLSRYADGFLLLSILWML